MLFSVWPDPKRPPQEVLDLARMMIAGSDDHIVDAIGRYVEQGYDEFIVFDGSLGSSAEERRDAYRRFRSDIASQF